MAKSNQQTLKEAINEFLKTANLDTKLKEVKLVDSWERVVGKLIAKHTKDLFIKNKILYVTLDSSALKQELTYSHEKIIKMLNDSAGETVLEDVIFK